MTDDNSFMTESDWLASADHKQIYCPHPNIQPERMIQFLRVHRRVDRTKQGRRKLRLFACACCRRFWSSLSEDSRIALKIAERHADGEASKKDLGFAWRISDQQCGNGTRTADGVAGHVVEASAMTAAALVPLVSYAVFASTPKHPHELWNEKFQEAVIIHDVFGNPFRKTAADAASQFAKVEAVRKLAEDIYQKRDFGRLLKLAAVLEQAGCTNAEVLEHCRQSEHFRGCWLLDVLRGIAC